MIFVGYEDAAPYDVRCTLPCPTCHAPARHACRGILFGLPLKTPHKGRTS